MNTVNDFIRAIAPYQDKDYFVGGHPVPRDAGRQSDNAGMFTAEMLRIVNDLDSSEDPTTKMKDMLDSSGVLHRYPGMEVDTSPDNFLGFLNYCSIFSNRQVLSKRLLWRGIKGLGSYTSSWTRAGFMFRQPQLVAAMIAASGELPTWNMFVFLYNANLVFSIMYLNAYNLFVLPFVLMGVLSILLVPYTALVIAVGGYKKDPVTDQDSRRLTWHLSRIMEGSLLCRIGSFFFFRRLRKDYGDEGMRLVFSRYFSPEHPFAKFTINHWEMK